MSRLSRLLYLHRSPEACAGEGLSVRVLTLALLLAAAASRTTPRFSLFYLFGRLRLLHYWFRLLFGSGSETESGTLTGKVIKIL